MKKNLKKYFLPFTWNDLLSRDSIKSIATYLNQRFIKIRGRPEDIACGTAIGLFIGMTPTIGIQMYIAIFIAPISKKARYPLRSVYGSPIPSPFPFFMD